MIITKLKDEAIAQKQINPKWKNIYYNKDGSNGYGHKIFDTQEKAEEKALVIVGKIMKGESIGVDTNGVRHTQFSYAWHKQIPIL